MKTQVMTGSRTLGGIKRLFSNNHHVVKGVGKGSTGPPATVFPFGATCIALHNIGDAAVKYNFTGRNPATASELAVGARLEFSFNEPVHKIHLYTNSTSTGVKVDVMALGMSS
jgi:hypothetical protein